MSGRRDFTPLAERVPGSRPGGCRYLGRLSPGEFDVLDRLRLEEWATATTDHLLFGRTYDAATRHLSRMCRVGLIANTSDPRNTKKTRAVYMATPVGRDAYAEALAWIDAQNGDA